MHRTRTILSSLVVVASALGAMGCSSSSSASPGGSGGSTVSFQADVLPIFQQSCETGSVCHGQPMNAGEENLYLGEMGEDAGVISDVYTGLVNVKSLENPSMNLVTPGSPSTSWLFQKISDTQDMLNAVGGACATGTCNAPTCTTSTPCGTTMPYLNSMLVSADPAALQTINDWITQGAMNN